jgi:hypothetical protein
MKLTGRQFEALQQALLSAFPTHQELQQMLFYGMSVNLDTIATGNLNDVVFSLIKWANAQGRLEELLEAAVQRNSGNPELLAFVASMPNTTVAPVITPDPAGGRPQVGVATPTATGGPSTPTPPTNGPATTGGSARTTTPRQIEQDDQDMLRNLIRNIKPVQDTLGPRRAFLKRAGLSEVWIDNYDWTGAPVDVATQLLDETMGQGVPLSGGRKGYTALGAVLDQMLRDELVGMEAGEFLSAVIARYKLINLATANISSQLRALLQITPGIEPVAEAQLEKTLTSFGAYLNAKWLWDGIKATQAVCRIEVPVTSHGQPSVVFGTGFLLGPSLVMTNHHVVRALIDGKDNDGVVLPPDKLTLRFGYQISDDGLTPENGQTYSLAAPDWLVDNSPENEFDYALLRVAGTPGEDPLRDKTRGWLTTDTSYTFKPNDPLYIIQHPLFPNKNQSEPLKVVLSPNSIISVSPDGRRVAYKTDTEPGSSGSPCFTANWGLVALHRAGSSQYNEGVPLSNIISRPAVQAALP